MKKAVKKKPEAKYIPRVEITLRGNSTAEGEWMSLEMICIAEEILDKSALDVAGVLALLKKMKYPDPQPKFAVKITSVDWYSRAGKAPPLVFSQSSEVIKERVGELTAKQEHIMTNFIFCEEVRELTEDEFNRREFLQEV